MAFLSTISVLNGSFVNAAGIVIGSFIGIALGKGMPERLSKMLMKALGFCTLYIGMTGALKGQNTLVIILSLVFGAALGEWADLDLQVNRLGQWIERHWKAKNSQSSIAEGFVNACLLFCVGAMVIVGSLNSGLNGDHSTLYTKAFLDFISSIVFASTMGLGVALSAVAVFLLQGGISLAAHLVAPFLGDAVVAEMTCIGSLLIVGLSFNLLGMTKLKIMNFVPAIFLPLLLCPLFNWLSTLAGVG